MALENLKPRGYRGGPRLELDEDHLTLMIGLIGRYHAVSYAMKIREPKRFDALVAGMKPLPFLPSAGAKENFYTVLYGVAYERFFAFVDKMQVEDGAATTTTTFTKNVNNLKHKYGDNPMVLMENFRRADETFSVILHGDYNRNNVLFQYDSNEGHVNPKDIKMIDFQVSAMRLAHTHTHKKKLIKSVFCFVAKCKKKYEPYRKKKSREQNELFK